jgi:hypothetical protein
MRLSVRDNEPGKWLLELLVQAGRQPVVFLDGLKQECAVAVDDTEGWVERQKVDDAGRLMGLERVFGKVKICLDPYE